MAGEQFVVLQGGFPQKERQPDHQALRRRLHDRHSSVDHCAHSVDGCVSDTEGKMAAFCRLHHINRPEWDSLNNYVTLCV